MNRSGQVDVRVAPSFTRGEIHFITSPLSLCPPSGLAATPGKAVQVLPPRSLSRSSIAQEDYKVHLCCRLPPFSEALRSANARSMPRSTAHAPSELRPRGRLRERPRGKHCSKNRAEFSSGRLLPASTPESPPVLRGHLIGRAFAVLETRLLFNRHLSNNWVRNCITSLFKGRFRYIV
jgi:hypothetical protein